MRYQIIIFLCHPRRRSRIQSLKFFIVLTCSYSFAAYQKPSEVDEYLQKMQDLKSIKQKLQKDALHHHEQLFNDLQNLGRTVGRVATSVILLTDKTDSSSSSRFGKQNPVIDTKSNLSGADKTNIVQAVVAGFVLMVEFARFCHARSAHKRMVKALRYEDFVQNFPQLILVEYQIILMKTLISLTIQGNLPEKIFACIQLTQMSLPYPYAKFANKAAKKMFKLCFDHQGNLINFDLSSVKHPYKKFAQKVAPDWQEIVLRADQFELEIQTHYDSTVAVKIDTALNNALIKMIHAGMKNDLQTVQMMHQKYAGNAVVEKLFGFYCGLNL